MAQRTFNINQFNDAINTFRRGLPNEFLSINRNMALSAVDMITERLVEKGVMGNGKSLGKYSDNPISPGYLIGQGLGSEADKKVEAYLKAQSKSGGVPGISYKKFRELNNRPTDHVTLSFSGDTLDDLGILEETNSAGVTLTSVGSKNSKQKDVTDKRGKKTGTVGTGDVLDQLANRYGEEILALNKTEEQILIEAADTELQNYLDRIFGD